MLRLLKKKSSFRRSKEFKPSSSSSNAAGSSSTSASADPRGARDHATSSSSVYTAKEYSHSSWDRRSNASNQHRYYSVSTQGLEAEDSSTQILQYARPPENLTSPVRESSGLLQETSLTPSPGLAKRIAEEKARLAASEQANGGASSAPKRGSGVINSLRQSFRRNKRKSLGSVPEAEVQRQQQEQQPVAPQRAQRKLSAPHVGGRRAERGSQGILSATSGNRLSGGVAPGKPVQVVAPFQRELPLQLATQQVQGVPLPKSSKEEAAEDKTTMRDPALVAPSLTATANAAAANNINNNHVMPTAATTQQSQTRRLPQTPARQSSSASAHSSGGSSAAAAVLAATRSSREAAQVAPLVSPTSSSSTSHHHGHGHGHHHGHSSSGHYPPKPAQRMSLRKVENTQQFGKRGALQTLLLPFSN